MKPNQVLQEDVKYIHRQLKDELYPIKRQRIVIIGAGGFLGYYLVETLVGWNAFLAEEDRNQLILIDPLVRGAPPWWRAWVKDPQIQIYSGIEYLIEMNSIHYVIYAASIAAPSDYRSRPMETIDANVFQFKKILDWVQSVSTLKGLLYFSSSEIYGNPQEEFIPTSENYFGNVNSLGPRSCYDESKRFAETLCYFYFQQYGMPIKIVRPFNNFGPGMKLRDGRLLPDLVRNIFENEDLILFSNGKDTRTFCYVADGVIGFFKILLGGKPGEAYNIGCPTPEISVNHFAQKLQVIAKELYNYQGQIRFEESSDPHYLTENPKRRCPIIEKAQKELGFNPTISLEQGLKKTLHWLDAILNV